MRCDEVLGGEWGPCSLCENVRAGHAYGRLGTSDQQILATDRERRIAAFCLGSARKGAHEKHLFGNMQLLAGGTS